MATVGFCQGTCSLWADKPCVIRVVGRWLSDSGWFSGAPGDVLYFRYGRLFVLVYLLVIVALVALHHLQVSRSLGAATGLRRGYRMLLISLSQAAAGDFFSYGVGVVSEAAWRYGFALEMLSLPGVVAGSVWYGLAVRRAGVLQQ
jgi:hypothetical protein